VRATPTHPGPRETLAVVFAQIGSMLGRLAEARTRWCRTPGTGTMWRSMKPAELASTFAGLAFRQDAELGNLNGHPIVARRIDGPRRAPGWEMHPDTDELFHVVEGHMEVLVMTADGPEAVDLPAGSVFVIPRAHWHQPATLEPTSLVFMTPGETEWTDAEHAPPPAL
jgi:mannose-6-phosphate isomerase-like protein (cupin superfamily)